MDGCPRHAAKWKEKQFIEDTSGMIHFLFKSLFVHVYVHVCLYVYKYNHH